MKAKSSIFINVFISLLLCRESRSETDVWLSPPAQGFRTQVPIEDVNSSDFFEVALSKFETAKNRLGSTAFLMIGNAAIDHFGQRNFRCGEGKQAYLVRAIYMNGSTGQYHVKRYGSSLLVTHGSLGVASGEKRSALVVCLNFEPVAVYGEIEGLL